MNVSARESAELSWGPVFPSLLFDSRAATFSTEQESLGAVQRGAVDRWAGHRDLDLC